MALQHQTMGRSAQRAYDDISPPEREELDDVALAALQALPVMLEETFGDQRAPWFAKAARLLDAGDDIAFASLCRQARNDYVMGQIEDLMEDDEVSGDEAMGQLLRRAAA